jgi:hypothetical protein
MRSIVAGAEALAEGQAEHRRKNAQHRGRRGGLGAAEPSTGVKMRSIVAGAEGSAQPNRAPA